MGAEFNPFSPENRLDPYPHYHALRAEDPVHYWPLSQGWVLTRYADVVSVLRDPRVSADRTRSTMSQILGPPPIPEEFLDTFEAIQRRSMLTMDPPDHTRLRRLVTKAFTPRMVESLRPRIEQIVADLLAAVGDGKMDLIRDLAYPLPVTVIAEMLGVPIEDRATFKRWSEELLVLTEPFVPIEGALHSAAEMRRYLEGVYAERRRQPRNDLISALVATDEDGDVLTEQELFAMCLLLLIAGHETTTNLIGNAVLALLRHPDERRRLQADPTLMRNAIEEFLRYDSIVQATARVATEDLEVGGKAIRTGEFIILVLGAANRDPAEFPDPDRLDVCRQDIQHVAFGNGIHFCLGAQLARTEALIALDALLRRYPRFEGDHDQLHYKTTALLRGLQSLPLAL